MSGDIGSHDVEWVVDTIAPYHATSYSEFFIMYKVWDFGAVKMKNASSSKIVGFINVQIKIDIGCIIVLKDDL